MRRWFLALALGAAGCGDVQHRADADVVERCNPAVPLECQGDDLVMCDAEGNPTVQPCALGCLDDERCGEVDATNRLTQFIDGAATGPDLVLPDGSTIDSNDGAVVVDGLPIEIESILLEAPPVIGGIPVRVFVVHSLEVSGAVFTQGSPALAVVSDSDIAIRGVVRALAGPGIDSAGDGGGYVMCNPDPVMATIGGQGGGSYASRGGDGGDVTGGAQGGDPGPIVGTKTIIPLRGGGTNASIQAAGGSIQLVSRTRIEISGGGAINAGGLGGADNNSGGGSGGGIVLEAPVVVVSSGGALAANGGGGGCGGGTVTQSAEEGRLDDQRADGCFSDDEGDGGRGGAGDNPAGMPGQTITGCGVVAGAGGGSVGRIRISDANGDFVLEDGAIVSPPANLSNVGVR